MVTNNINTVLDQEWIFRSSVYVPTGNNILSDGSLTTVDLTLDEAGTGLANLAAVNSDKLDFGSVLPLKIDVMAALEWFAAVVADNSVNMFWAESAHSSAGIGNPGFPDGVDGVYTGAGDGGTDEEAVVNMIDIGAMITETHTAGHVQIAKIGSFVPTMRYGQLIVVNNSGTLLCGTDDIESGILFYGTMPQIQADV